MKKRHAILLGCVIVFCGAMQAQPVKTTGPVSLPIFSRIDFSKHQPCKVARVVDGDTIVVVRNGKKTTVRLQGVDTPETKHPHKPVQAYGPEASLFLANLLQGEKVYLLPVGDKLHTGKYGRLIAYVYRAPDGLFVNAEIIRQGYGYAYPKYPGRHTKKFGRIERFAKEAKKGLWVGVNHVKQSKKKPMKISQLRRAAKRYLHKSSRMTDAARQRHRKKTIDGLVGQRVVLRGRIKEVTADKNEAFVISMQYKSRRQIKYKTATGTGFCVRTSSVSEPAEIINATITTDDSTAIALKRESAITIEGTISSVAFAGGLPLGTKITIALQDGKIVSK